MSGNQSSTSTKRWGRFLTPDPIAKVAADWAIQTKLDSLFDVATGEGVFLVYATRRLKELGARTEDIADQIYGAEISRPSYKRARLRLLGLEGVLAEHLYNGDFFDIKSAHMGGVGKGGTKEGIPEVQAALGNPPFIRYSMIERTTRRKALTRAAEAGVDMKGPVDASVLFLIHASSLVGDNGRLALVVPERILFTSYGSFARNYLMERFGSVRLILCNGWSFSQASERVVLVLATDSESPSFTIERMNFDSNTPLASVSPLGAQRLEWKEAWQDVWARTKLDSKDYEQFKRAITNPNLHVLKEFSKIEIGCVTGANGFFLVNKELIDQYSLPRTYFRRAVARARHVSGLFFENDDWLQLLENNENCLLLRIDQNHMPNGSREIQSYLRRGKRLGIREGYKLSHRRKWYKVPTYRTPEAFFTYMNHLFPRLVINGTNAVNLNSIHSVRLNVSNPTAFCTGFYNSLTLLSCELSGRVYNGGVLKIEPGELKQVLVVEPSKLGLAEDLVRFTPAIDKRLTRGDLEGVLDIVDPVVLGDGLKLGDAEINALRNSYTKMRESRID